MDKSIFGIYTALCSLKRLATNMVADTLHIADVWLTAPISSPYNALVWVLREYGCDEHDIKSAIHRFEKEHGFDNYGCDDILDRPLIRLQNQLVESETFANQLIKLKNQEQQEQANLLFNVLM